MLSKLNLGRVAVTPGALEVLQTPRIQQLLERHANGDWGWDSDADKRLNDEALRLRDRVLSAYAIDESKPSKGAGENTVWIVTEANRSVTTILLPDEYWM